MRPAARILLVEDDEYDSRLTQHALAAAGGAADLRVVGDGQEALAYLRRQGACAGRAPAQPALVLLDLKMPRADGFEVLAELKGDPALRVIPVVVLSSSRQPGDVARAYELGANGYVVKTMDFEAFTAAVQALRRFWLDVNEAPPPCLGRSEP